MPNNNLRLSLEHAIKYASDRNIDIPDSLMVEARRLGIGFKASDNDAYKVIRDNYWEGIYDNVEAYLDSNDAITLYRNNVRKAVADAFVSTGDIAYVDGGGELPLDEDTLLWLSAVQEAELGYVDAMFQTLKEMRGEEDTDAIHEAFTRADKWTQTLDSIYSQAKLYGAKNKMLTWNLGDTEAHCTTCSRLDGQRHKASWYIGHNYIPGRPGASLECGGYRCDCRLLDSDGNEFTI